MTRTARLSSVVASLLLAAALPFAALTPAAALPLAAPAAHPARVAADGEVTWSVEPVATTAGPRSRFEYEIDPGTQIQDAVVIANRGETPADFVIYATDAVNDPETGAFGLLPSDVDPSDAGSWVTAASEAITLQPGTEATVPFSIVVPSDATPGDHVAGIVAAVLTEGEQDGAAVLLEQRVGARIYLDIAGARVPELEVTAVTSAYSASWNPFAPGDLEVAYTVRNSGNVRLDAQQDLTITGPLGIPLGTAEPAAVHELLPGQSVRVIVDVPSVLAALLAWSDVTVTPGVVGSATEGTDPEADAAQPGDAESEATESGATGAPSDPSTPTPDPSADPDAVVDASAVGQTEFEPVHGSGFTLALSWTLLALVLLLVFLVWLVARYVSVTRERMYLAIDEAAANAREEARADGSETNR